MTLKEISNWQVKINNFIHKDSRHAYLAYVILVYLGPQHHISGIFLSAVLQTDSFWALWQFKESVLLYYLQKFTNLQKQKTAKSHKCLLYVIMLLQLGMKLESTCFVLPKQMNYMCIYLTLKSKGGWTFEWLRAALSKLVTLTFYFQWLWF